METRAKSGWLSKEQLAGSEFARRVAVKHGIGVVAALMKKKELVRMCVLYVLLAAIARDTRVCVTSVFSTNRLTANEFCQSW